jgi:hypothetical protein
MLMPLGAEQSREQHLRPPLVLRRTEQDFAQMCKEISTLVPVLSDVVGQERPVRVSVPAALSEIPKIKLVIDHARGFIGKL